ncbi:MAG: hypothetical protein HRT71_06205 [Flavobacteriales bacterium]|nr:hypothetical protein [Flavobacteriales bacterium]
MKLSFLLITMMMLAAFAQGQDLIVTQEGDSINCRITNEQDGLVYFTSKVDGKYTNTNLPENQITSVVKGFYIGKGNEDLIGSKKRKYPQFRIGANAGLTYYFFGFIPDDTDDWIREYYKDLRTGFNFNIDAFYYPDKNWGIGFRYHSFNSSVQQDSVVVTFPDSTTKFGMIRDDISISYIGPVFSARYIGPDNSYIFYGNLSIGWVTFYNDGLLVDTFTEKGYAIGQYGSLGIEYFIDYGLSIGVEIGATRAFVTDYRVNDNGYHYTESNPDYAKAIYLFDISIGLRYTY